MKKFLLFSFLLVAVSQASAQTCTVWDTVFTADGLTPAGKGIEIILHRAEKAGVLIIASPIRYFTNRNGIFSFKVVQGANAWIQAPIAGFRTAGGVAVAIPASDSVRLSTLQSLGLIKTAGLLVRDDGVDVDLVDSLDFLSDFSATAIGTQRAKIKLKINLNADDFSTMYAAFDQAETDTAMLIVNSRQTITQNDTLKLPAAIYITPKGKLRIASGDTLWIFGSFSAGLYQVFEGSGKVVFGDQSTFEIVPQWWGAVGDGATDNTTALQTAFDAVYASQSGSGNSSRLYVPKGVYLTGTITAKNQTANGQPVVFYGDGGSGGGTAFKLKTNINGPLFDIGGPNINDGVNTLKWSDFSVDGNKANQTTEAPLIRMRRVDRSVFQRIYATSSKGDNFHIEASSVELQGCQSFSADSSGIYIDGCNSIVVRGGYINNNGLYGIQFGYTNTDVVTTQNRLNAHITEVHLEQNSTGEILIDSYDNVAIINNNINPASGISEAIIVRHGSRTNIIKDNLFDTASDNPTYEDGTGSAGDNYVISFDSATVNNVYDKNLRYSSDAGTGENFLFEAQALDKGVNYSSGPEALQLRQFFGDGGHSGFWWITRQTTNWISRTDSEDLTTANWTAAQISSRANNTSVGNPADPSGSATLVGFNSSVVGKLTYKTGTISVAIGDIVSATIYLRMNGTWSSGTQDLRLQILDKSGTLLAQRAFRYKDKWEPYSVSYRADAAYDTLQFQILKPGYTATNGVHFWGATFGKTRMSFIPGGATLEPGLSILNARVRRRLSLGNGSSQYHLLSAYDTAPTAAFTDIDVNKNVSSTAQASDTAAVVIDASATQPLLGIINATGARVDWIGLQATSYASSTNQMWVNSGADTLFIRLGGNAKFLKLTDLGSAH